MKHLSKYHPLVCFLIAVLLASTACQREEVVPVTGETGTTGTLRDPSVLVLDTSSLTNPVRVNGQVRFDIIGNLSEIRKGDKIFYPAGNGIYGVVSQSFQSDSRLTMGISRVPLSAFWPEVILEDTVVGSLLVSRKRMFADSWISDTLSLEDLVLFDDEWQGSHLKVLLPNVSVSSSALTFQQVGAAGDNPWLRRFEISTGYKMYLKGNLHVESTGALNASDSLLLEESVYGPCKTGDLPVYYSIKTWLGYSVIFKSDTTLEFSFHDYQAGFSGFTNNFWSGWNASERSDVSNAMITPGKTPTFTGFYAEVFVSQQIIPIFCGEPGLQQTNRISESILREVDLPEWSQKIQSDFTSRISQAGLALGDFSTLAVPVQRRSSYLSSGAGTLPNQKPRARFTISPKTGFTVTSFEFNAAGSSDHESSPEQLSVRWDYESDGTFDTDYSVNKVSYHIFSVPGSYQVTLEVRDPEGLTDRYSAIVEVYISSSAPIAHFEVSPPNGRISTLFLFDASGCLDVQDPVALLQVRWDFNGDGEWDTPFSTFKSQGYFFRNPGNYITKLEVLDTEGLTGSTSKLIKVENVNIKPTAVFKVDPQKGTTETLFTFDASGSTDPEDASDLLRVRWDWNNDGYWDTEYRTIKTIQRRFAEAGTYTVVLEVTDTEGFASTFDKTIQITNPNTAPTADFAVNPAEGTTETLFEFDASGCTDNEDHLEQLEVRWDWDNDNTYDTDFVTEKVIRRTFSTPGTYIIIVQVRDSGGLTDTKARLLVVR